MASKASSTPRSTNAARSVLLFLTLINLFNYLDRYILVALSPAIKRDLHLTDTEVGLLASAFMVSYFLISPLFGFLADRGPRLRVMSAGVGIWSLATAACGFGRGAIDFIIARLFVGVGEAAYGTASPALLRDLFPPQKTGKIFAIFFMAIPVGSALGYLLGGILEKSVGWRSAFFFAGVPGLFLALGLLFLREPKRGAFDEGFEADKGPMPSWTELFRNPTYVLTVLGYCAYTFGLGGVAVWIPHYIERYLGVPASEGNMAFGGITVASGFLGTFVGGAWADRWAKRSGDAYLKLSALSMIVAVPVFIWVLEAKTFSSFCVAVFCLEFLLFLSTSPINAEVVNCVVPRMRATATAFSIFAIHLLGDAISPTLVGKISDLSSLKEGMWLLLSAILLGGIIWSWKVIAEWGAMPWPAQALKLPQAQCHRGFHKGGIQENTLEAFRAAAQAGAKMVELDVRLSKDGQAVVIHDEDTLRVAGKKLMVAMSTAAELKASANAPTLLEVLQDPACGPLLVNVELKHLGAENNALAAAACNAIQQARSESRVMFSSFNPFLLRAASRLLPQVPRALLATLEADPKNRFYLRKMWLAFLARPHMLNYDHRFFTPALAQRLAARRVPVSLWTVASPDEARKFLAMGVESIISDSPNII